MPTVKVSGNWLVAIDCVFFGNSTITTKANGDIMYRPPTKVVGKNYFYYLYETAYAPSGSGMMKMTVAYAYKTNTTQIQFPANTKYFDLKTGEVYLFTKTVSLKTSGSLVKLNGSCKYLRTDIIKAPTTRFEGITLKKSNNSSPSFTVSWKVPSAMTNTKSNSRATQTDIVVTARPTSGGAAKAVYWTDVPISTTSKTFEIYPYYPQSSTDAKYSSVNVTLRASNYVGKYDSPLVSYIFERPRMPDAFTLAQNANTGVVSTTIKTNAGTDAYNRYDTAYTLSVYRSQTNKTTQIVSSRTTSTSFTVSTDVSDRQSIPYGSYIRVTASAYARGIAGNSNTRTADYYISFPNLPSINMGVVGNVSSASRTTINVNTNSKKEFPVTGVRLQKLISVDYETAGQIPADANWQNVGPQDNGGCSAMSVATEDIVPQAGKKTWLRVKTWNDIEGIFYRYSVPIRVKALETPAPVTPSAQDDNATILSCTVGPDGTSAYLQVAWDPTTGTDDSNVTEISWSDNENAWKSTDQPDTFMLTDSVWNEGQVTSGGVTYRKSTHVYVTGLESGTKYYLSARRVLVPQDGETTYGPYCTKVAIVISDANIAPASVTLTADSTAIRGEDIPLSWSYGSDMAQDSWAVKKMVGATVNAANDITLASGSDARLGYSQPYYRDKDRTISIASASSKDIALYVVVNVGGISLTSAPVTVRFLDKPVLEVSAATATMQPASVVAFTNSPASDVSLVVESTGVSGSTPDGTETQNDGDAIWSQTLTPEWEVVSSIASDTDVADAKDALDAAQAAYDALVDAYEEAKSEYETATSEVERLTAKIAEEERDADNVEDELDAAQDVLDSMTEDDPFYGEHEQQVAVLQDRLDELTAAIEDDGTALEQAESDAQDAHDAMEAIDYSDEEAALLAAMAAYSAAVASAIGPSDPDTVTHRATINLPTGLDMKDGSSYRVRAFATDPATGIDSDEQTCEFDVSWTHQAPAPSMDIQVTPINEIPENAQRMLGTSIAMSQPLRALSSDVYDLYRVTKDGTSLALADIPTDATVTDKFAAFGNVSTAYVVACRTTDGDVDWLEFPYELHESELWYRSMVRVDWDGKCIELDRNVAPSDSYKKDFVTHRHIDGSTSGHWNSGVARTMGIRAAIVRGREAEQEMLLRELAKYDGPCLVRTTDGVWVEGNVEVEAIEFGSRTSKVEVSLQVTETTPSGTFAPTIDEEEEQQEEPQEEQQEPGE